MNVPDIKDYKLPRDTTTIPRQEIEDEIKRWLNITKETIYDLNELNFISLVRWLNECVVVLTKYHNTDGDKDEWSWVADTVDTIITGNTTHELAMVFYRNVQHCDNRFYIVLLSAKLGDLKFYFLENNGHRGIFVESHWYNLRKSSVEELTEKLKEVEKFKNDLSYMLNYSKTTLKDLK